MTTQKFNIGKIYEMRFITDSNLTVKFVCVKRTEKSATFQSVDKKEVLNRRIKVWDNCEYILEGNYSMAPSIKAINVCN